MFVGDIPIEALRSAGSSVKQRWVCRSIRALARVPANIAARRLPTAGNAGAFAALSAAEHAVAGLTMLAQKLQ